MLLLGKPTRKEDVMPTVKKVLERKELGRKMLWFMGKVYSIPRYMRLGTPYECAAFAAYVVTRRINGNFGFRTGFENAFIFYDNQLLGRGVGGEQEWTKKWKEREALKTKERAESLIGQTNYASTDDILPKFTEKTAWKEAKLEARNHLMWSRAYIKKIVIQWLKEEPGIDGYSPWHNFRGDVLRLWSSGGWRRYQKEGQAAFKRWTEHRSDYLSGDEEEE